MALLRGASDCDPAVDCTPNAREVCARLWRAKEAACATKRGPWRGLCPAPKYTDPATGHLRDCKRGCCAPQEPEPCLSQCAACNGCYESGAHLAESQQCSALHYSTGACATCEKCGTGPECAEECKPCWSGFEACLPCGSSCAECKECWDARITPHDDDGHLPVAVAEREATTCEPTCEDCDACWADPGKQLAADECFAAHKGNEVCHDCEACVSEHGDWAGPCSATCETCRQSSVWVECDQCTDRCQACSACWAEPVGLVRRHRAVQRQRPHTR